MITTYYKNCVSGNIFGTKTDPAIPASYYIGLSTTEPNAEGSNVTEPSGDAGYARVQLANLSEPVDGVVSNNQDVTFDESTSSWGTITHYVIYDQLTGGNLLLYNSLTTPREVEAASIMTIKSGSLKLKVVPISE